MRYLQPINLNEANMVLYILGAGASYGSFDEKQNRRVEGIATVKDIPKEMGLFLDFLKNERDYFKEADPNKHSGSNADFFDNFDKLINSVDWTLTKISNQLSFDTFARKIRLQFGKNMIKKQQELAKVKCAFTCFLLFQELTSRVDKRYDGFFASLVYENGRVPKLDDNVNIITWNYDVQLQRSLCSFNNERLIRSAFEVAAEYSPALTSPGGRIQIARLNGSALYYKRVIDDTFDHSEFFNKLEFEPRSLDSHKLLLEIFHEFMDFYKNGNSAIFFSWDINENEYLRTSLQYAKKWASEANKIVIIGYSFPYFNRIIDQEIFDNVNDGTEIIIQDPKAKDVESALLTIKNFKTKLFTSVDQFYIPRDLGLIAKAQ